MTHSEKQKGELNAFLRFVDISGIEADRSTISQPGPPSPDIVCRVAGEEIGFELTAITDPIIERKFGTGKFHYSNFRIDIKDAVACISRKSQKRYAMSSVELIVHEGYTPIDDLWIWDQSKLDAAVQKATDETVFSRVWLVDISNRRFRAYVPRTRS